MASILKVDKIVDSGSNVLATSSGSGYTGIPAAGITGTLGSGVTGGSGLDATAFVKLASGEAHSGGALTIEGFYTSDYIAYKFLIMGLTHADASNADNIRMNMRNSSGDISTHNHVSHESNMTSGGTHNHGAQTSYGWTFANVRITGPNGVDNSYKGDLELDIYDPLSDRFKHGMWRHSYIGGDGLTYQNARGGFTVGQTNQLTGIKMFTNNYNLVVDHWRLYGLRG